jgi:RimJ/RimL family protein N-acetyltransferase
MGTGPQLRTERLLLRRWRASDLEPFAALNADPAVMEHFPATLSRAQSAALVERIERCFEERGYGLWAVEFPGEAPFIGFVGLAPVDIDVAFAPAVELGWRLARHYWDRGIATEAARAASTVGLEQLHLPGLLAYTAASNERSRRVMERLGMRRDPTEDFLHPRLPATHPLAPHVLYRLTAPGTR